MNYHIERQRYIWILYCNKKPIYRSVNKRKVMQLYEYYVNGRRPDEDCFLR